MKSELLGRLAVKEILRVLSGSRLYGLALPGSDRDEVAITIPTMEDLLSVEYSPKSVSQKIALGIDLKSMDFSSFALGAYKGNCHYVSHLWSDVLSCSDEGRVLLKNRNLFISKRILVVSGEMLRKAACGIRTKSPGRWATDAYHLLIGAILGMGICNGDLSFPLSERLLHIEEYSALVDELTLSLSSINPDIPDEVDMSLVNRLYFNLVMGNEDPSNA